MRTTNWEIYVSDLWFFFLLYAYCLTSDRNENYLTINHHFYRRIGQSYCIKLDIYKSHCEAVYANKTSIIMQACNRGFCLLERFINIFGQLCNCDLFNIFYIIFLIVFYDLMFALFITGRCF